MPCVAEALTIDLPVTVMRALQVAGREEPVQT